eukprot:2457978-Rhodomonas_salina.5
MTPGRTIAYVSTGCDVAKRSYVCSLTLYIMIANALDSMGKCSDSLSMQRCRMVYLGAKGRNQTMSKARHHSSMSYLTLHSLVTANA